MSGVENKGNITVHDASENNLKHITVQFPLDRFTCVTGPSGCGKSSLVFDTIYAESQRSFLESMSGNMFGQKLLDKPKVDYIDNLRPALNISQNYYNVNPRSTVGTITDISYYLRTLYAFVIGQENGNHVDMNFFSPNNPSSCCPHCNGLGEEYVISEQSVIPDKGKSLAAGGIVYYKGSKTSQEHKLLQAICDYYGIDINKKVKDLTADERYLLLYRTEPQRFEIRYKTPKGRYKHESFTECGAMVELKEKLKDIHIPSTFASIAKYLVKEICSSCHGQKLSLSVREMKICGLGIGETEQLSMTELTSWCNSVRRNYRQTEYCNQVEQLLSDIERRVQHLIDLKMGYICVGRSIPSLSGGELQRVRLATQLDCSLSGLVYILDEPCKGLHYRNIDAIIESAKKLIDRGNTVIAIEHNKQFIDSAEHVIEMGPAGGPNGGYVLFAGKRESANRYHIDFKIPRKAKKHATLSGVSYHNLKGINISIPVGNVVCISGVSGSGKSSLADILEQCCEKGESAFCREASGFSNFKKVMRVNQQPIGKTARSTVVSYLGIFDSIRDTFAKTEKAQNKGLGSSDFSMNVAGGRCECCQGTGRQKIELAYLPETYIQCPECKGRRFQPNVLEVKYKGYAIDEILNMSISDLIPVFENNVSITSMLRCMEMIGMGYVSLGQMSMSLSGGEAQRIKLAKYLGLNSSGSSLFILDEPTSGLNQDNIDLLVEVINKLADNGETIVIIEHNVEFIARIADYLIDLGNLAGNTGGTTVIEGDPKTVMNTKGSSWEQITNSMAK